MIQTIQASIAYSLYYPHPQLSSSSHSHHSNHKYDVNPLVNVGVKIDLPMFNEEPSTKKLDN